MRRFSYLIARIIILTLIGLICWIGHQPAIRVIVQKYLEKATGGVVEFGKLDSNLVDGVLQIRDLQIAHPANPERNLLQSDEAYLKFDPGQLASRRFVVTEGQLKGLRIDAPRTKPGLVLESTRALTPERPALITPRLTESSKQVAQNWLDQISGLALSQGNPVPQRETDVQKIRERWQAELAELQKVAEETRQRLESARSQLVEQNRLSQNPLRDEGHLNPFHQAVEGLQADLATAQSRLEQIAERSRQEIEAYVTQRVSSSGTSPRATLPSIDPQWITQMLFDQLAIDQATLTLEWVHWFQNVYPSARASFHPQPVRGRHLFFRGESLAPEFLIRHADFEGSSTVQGQHYEIAGQLENYSLEPHLVSEPTTIRLRAQGSRHFSIQATLDHRTSESRETYHLECPDWKVLPQLLGNEAAFLANLDCQSTRAVADVTLVGDQVQGTVHLDHSGVVLHVDELAELAGGKDFRNFLNQNLNGIKEFDITIHLKGDSNRPTLTLESNLGLQFHQALLAAHQQRVELLAQQHALQTPKSTDLAQQLIRQLEQDCQNTRQKLSEQVTVASAIQAHFPKSQAREKKLR